MIPLPYLGETEIEEYTWVKRWPILSGPFIDSLASKLNDSRRECEELKKQLREVLK